LKTGNQKIKRRTECLHAGSTHRKGEKVRFPALAASLALCALHETHCKLTTDAEMGCSSARVSASQDVKNKDMNRNIKAGKAHRSASWVLACVVGLSQTQLETEYVKLY